MAKIIEVIETFETKGRGVDGSDPVRCVRQLWTKDGELLCEWDHYSESDVRGRENNG